MVNKKVIDLSYYNTVSDWSKVKASVDGVIIRVGYRGYGSSGMLMQDEKFKEYTDACVKHKIPFGFYFFSQAINEIEAKAEAGFVIDCIKGYKPDYPVYFDSEYSVSKNKAGRADGLSKAVRTSCAIAFCDEVKARGYKPGVYASESWFSDNLDFSKIKNYSIWVAKYSSVKPKTAAYDGWQYTSTGMVKGIIGSVDISTFYKDFVVTPPTITLNKTYTLTNVRGIYNGAGASSGRKKVKNLTASGKASATSSRSNDDAYLKAGAKVTILKTELAESGNLWAKIPSGWFCVWEKDKNKTYIK